MSRDCCVGSSLLDISKLDGRIAVLSSKEILVGIPSIIWAKVDSATSEASIVIKILLIRRNLSKSTLANEAIGGDVTLGKKFSIYEFKQDS